MMNPNIGFTKSALFYITARKAISVPIDQNSLYIEGGHFIHPPKNGGE